MSVVSSVMRIALLCGIVSDSPHFAVEAQPLASVSYGSGWRIEVWEDGIVEVTNSANSAQGGRRTLSGRDFRAFLDVLERERPWELNGVLGDLTPDGPQRAVVVRFRGKRSEFVLHRTPWGFEQVYRSDESGLSRALRFCEAIRGLASGYSVPACVDVAPSAR